MFFGNEDAAEGGANVDAVFGAMTVVTGAQHTMRPRACEQREEMRWRRRDRVEGRKERLDEACGVLGFRPLSIRRCL